MYFCGWYAMNNGFILTGLSVEVSVEHASGVLTSDDLQPLCEVYANCSTPLC